MSKTPNLETFVGPEDMPHADPEAVEDAYKAILARHALATLRADSGMTLEQVAERKGVTKAAAHQMETKPFGKIGVSSLVTHFQALGFRVDEDWVARTLTEALPQQA